MIYMLWMKAQNPNCLWQALKSNDIRAGGSKMQYRNTRQRKIVLEAVQEHHDHPSADQIYLEIRAKDPRISRGTVYRNLNILSEEGQITHVKVPGADRYDCRTDFHLSLIHI